MAAHCGADARRGLMPEGDTIFRTAAALRRFTGAAVVDAAPAALRRLRGQHLASVEARGKHLLMQFDSGLQLHSHMRMTGAWHIYPQGAAWRRPAHLATARLSFEGADCVLFSAPLLELRGPSEDPTAHLGPDILVTDDLDGVVERARTAAHATLGELLLDQRVCAGIGNIYKCEAVFARHLHPWAAPSSVDDAELRALYAAAQTMMRRSTTDQPRRRHAVHGRAGRPCPRCATLIRVRAQGEQARLTWWCPRCQPELRGRSG